MSIRCGLEEMNSSNEWRQPPNYRSDGMAALSAIGNDNRPCSTQSQGEQWLLRSVKAASTAKQTTLRPQRHDIFSTLLGLLPP